MRLQPEGLRDFSHAPCPLCATVPVLHEDEGEPIYFEHLLTFVPKSQEPCALSRTLYAPDTWQKIVSAFEQAARLGCFTQPQH